MVVAVIASTLVLVHIAERVKKEPDLPKVDTSVSERPGVAVIDENKILQVQAQVRHARQLSIYKISRGETD